MESNAGKEVRLADLTVSDGKRVATNDGEVELRSIKKAKNGGELRGNLKRVSEIVLVLEIMREMRGARTPTQAEIEMMSEAREKLVEVCQDFAPEDLFPAEAIGLAVDDLGLNKSGSQPPNIPISEKLKLANEKMEKSEEFSVHSTSCKSQRCQTTLPYQLPSSEVRPVVRSGSSSGHVGRNTSSLALSGAESPQFRLDMKSNGACTSQVQDNSPGNHMNPLTWSVQQLQSTSSVKIAPDSYVLVNASVKVEGAAEMSRVVQQTTTSKSFTSQTASVDPPLIQQHVQQGIEPEQPLSLTSKHSDIASTVQKLLQPKLSKHPIWTPPSREYMTKPLACQLCKLISNKEDNVLVCDGCEKGYHLKCLKIKSVPRGEWYCGKCLSLSNGKALPPKYGRAVRSIRTAPKVSTNSKAVQIPPQKRLGQLAGKFTRNGKFGIQNSSSSNHNKVSGTSFGPENQDLSWSNGLHKVDWVGDILKVGNKKTYYQSCSINGIVYKVNDHALFRLKSNTLTPYKLQSMWEDSKTRSKWVLASRCYFHEDLPKNVGRPYTPEKNAVYESNHDTAISAGLIEGPCKVLQPRLFNEEMQRITLSGRENSGPLPPLFLCKWFFDERKGLFRDGTI